MYFTSGHFLIFLFALLLLYYTVPKKWQWPLLLTAGLIFYAFSGPRNLIYILVTAGTTYAAAYGMNRMLEIQQSRLAAETAWDKARKKEYKTAVKHRRKVIFAVTLVLNLAMLSTLKFTAAAGIGFLLPMGVSFYTFQAVGYLIDAFRAGKPGFAEKNPLKFLLFVSFFPQLIQGPISRFDELKKTLFSQHRFNADEFLTGLLRAALGFFKKLVIADRLLVAVRSMTAIPEDYRGLFTLTAILLYAVTLYCDFTGGIDITIGAARMLGIRVQENFNRPFYSKNIAEYWRRWHITMGTWFRDYIFYPMSVSKPMLTLQKRLSARFSPKAASRVVVYLVTAVTWFATGIWHGASWNFIIWGLLNGAVIIISQEFAPLYGRFRKRFPVLWESKGYSAFQIVRTFLLMCVIRSLDIYPSVTAAAKNLASIAVAPEMKRFSIEGVSGLGLGPEDFILSAIAVAGLIAAGAVGARIKPETLSREAKLSMACGLALTVLVFGYYGLGVDMSQFIYNQF